MFLSSPREGACVTPTEYEDGIVIRVAVRGVDHRQQSDILSTLAQLNGHIKHHTSNIVGLCIGGSNEEQPRRMMGNIITVMQYYAILYTETVL